MSRVDAGPVLFVAVDAHNAHCMTEPLLDTWYVGLTPEEKAELYAIWDAAQRGDDSFDRAVAQITASFRAILSAPYTQPTLAAAEAAMLCSDHYAEA